MKTNSIKSILAAILLFTVSIIYAQDSGEIVALFFEFTEVTVPEDWEYAFDEDAGFFAMFSEDEALEIQIFDSLDQDESYDIDLDTPSDEALIAAYDGLFDIEIDADDIDVTEETDTLTIATIEFTEDNISYLVINTEAETVFMMDVYNLEGEALTEAQLERVVMVIESVQPVGSGSKVMEQASTTESCIVSVSVDDTVRMHVGPGTNRASIAFLDAGDYEALGQAQASDDTQWLKLDKEQIAPESSAAELWVAADDVEASSDCDDLVTASASPIIPQAAAPAQPSASSGNGNDSAPPASNNASGGSSGLQSGVYTLNFAPTVAANCVGFESVTLTSAELELTPETYQVRPTDNAISIGGDLFTLQSNGEYFGTYNFPDGDNAQLYLRVTNPTTIQGQMILNFTLEGDTCSATVGVSLSR